MGKILLPEKKRHYQCPELQEGIAPSEYNGMPIKLPEFNKNQEYGMWVTVDEEGSEQKIKAMLNVMISLIPVKSLPQVEFIFHNSDENAVTRVLGDTIGWKYTPKFHDETGGE